MLSIFKVTVLICLSVFAAPCWAQNIQKIEGTSISLEIPEGFVKASHSIGFWNPVSGSEILAAEIPLKAFEDFERIASDLEKVQAYFAGFGFQISDIYSKDFDGKVGYVLKEPIKQIDPEIRNFMVVIKSDKSILITFDINGDLNSGQIEDMISSLSISGQPTPQEQLSVLPYNVVPKDPFTNIIVLKDSVGLRTYENDDPDGLQPMIAIIPGKTLFETLGDPKNESTTSIKALRGFENAKIENQTNITIDEKDVVRTVATQNNKLIYFFRYPTSKREYLNIMAIGESTKMRELEPIVRDIVESISIR